MSNSEWAITNHNVVEPELDKSIPLGDSAFTDFYQRKV